MRKRWFYGLVSVLFTMSLMFFVPVGDVSAAPSKGTLVLADVNWDSVQVHNRIAGFILEHGYGYKPDYIPGATIALWAGMERGDIDITMEIWVDNQLEAYHRGINSGKVVDLGSNFPDSWQGWLVPTYVIKGDPERGIKPMAPDLKSVEDLPRYWKIFKDPENPDRGIFYSCIPGWECQKVNEKKFKAYGLDKYYNIFLPGSDAALNGSMAAAYRKGQPWFGYYWAPTWVLGKYDMTPIEEPPYDENKWGKSYACAYPSVKVNICVNSSLLKRAPEVVEFLKKYETTQDMANKFLAYMQDHGSDTGLAAIWFLKNYEPVWTTWVPADVEKKVKAALAKEK